MQRTVIKPVRVGVVGVGYFGRFHAKQYTANPNAALVAVADVDSAAARAAAGEFGCDAVVDFRQLIGRVDAVSLAAPTAHHYRIAKELIEAGIHVLIEKPMTLDASTAGELAELAERHRTVLQVGHIERFSSCFRALTGMIGRPRFIEGHRISPWRERGTDVDVIFDLMIHDIDIIMGLVKSPVTTVTAVGTPLFSPRIDLANARISFESGCVATVTASRVSHKTERSLRIFQVDDYLVCDFVDRRIVRYALAGDPAVMGIAAVSGSEQIVAQEDSLANEIAEFIDCIVNGRQPTVDGRVGLEAVQVASMIKESIEAHRSRFEHGQS